MKLFEADVQLGEEITVGGLSVFPLLGSGWDGPAYLAGPEAFERQLVEVAELDPPQVPYLEVTNLAELPLLLLEGEMLVGGDQNRTMNVTVLIPTKTRTVVPVSCVEQGRWGESGRRAVAEKRKFAPGALRSKKIESLEPRGTDTTSRQSNQGMVWEEVGRYEAIRESYSDTSALDDLQEVLENEIAHDLDRLAARSDQIGVVCTVGDDIVGLELFDRSTTLDKYLCSIVAGHALDVTDASERGDPIRAIERFLAEVDSAERSRGQGVGLGDEVLLEGRVTGIGLEFQGSLVHLAAFPTRKMSDLLHRRPHVLCLRHSPKLGLRREAAL